MTEVLKMDTPASPSTPRVAPEKATVDTLLEASAFTPTVEYSNTSEEHANTPNQDNVKRNLLTDFSQMAAAEVQAELPATQPELDEENVVETPASESPEEEAKIAEELISAIRDEIKDADANVQYDISYAEGYFSVLGPEAGTAHLERLLNLAPFVSAENRAEIVLIAAALIEAMHGVREILDDLQPQVQAKKRAKITDPSEN